MLGGPSGTGKSTLASLLASRLGISSVLSTDSVRHIMRNFMLKEENEVLFASTYEAGNALPQPEDPDIEAESALLPEPLAEGEDPPTLEELQAI